MNKKLIVVLCVLQCIYMGLSPKKNGYQRLQEEVTEEQQTAMQKIVELIQEKIEQIIKQTPERFIKLMTKVPDKLKERELNHTQQLQLQTIADQIEEISKSILEKSQKNLDGKKFKAYAQMAITGTKRATKKLTKKIVNDEALKQDFNRIAQLHQEAFAIVSEKYEPIDNIKLLEALTGHVDDGNTPETNNATTPKIGWIEFGIAAALGGGTALVANRAAQTRSGRELYRKFVGYKEMGPETWELVSEKARGLKVLFDEGKIDAQRYEQEMWYLTRDYSPESRQRIHRQMHTTG